MSEANKLFKPDEYTDPKLSFFALSMMLGLPDEDRARIWAVLREHRGEKVPKSNFERTVEALSRMYCERLKVDPDKVKQPYTQKTLDALGPEYELWEYTAFRTIMPIMEDLKIIRPELFK